jgi:uncharacterized membrane protein
VRPDLAILLLWVGFAGSHLVLSSLRLRPGIVARVGEQPFLGLYSLVAFAFFVPLVWIYIENVHFGPWLWSLPRGPLLTWLVNIGMGAAFVSIVSALVSPSPAAVAPGQATVRGMFRITRHPLVMGIGLFGLLHLLPNASTADVAFFGGFVAFALVGTWHQDQRKLATLPGYRPFHDATPFLPFTGKGVLQGLRELSPVAVVAGIALATAVRWAHRFWSGD